MAGTFLALGVTGRRSTQTVVEEAPVAAQSASSSSGRLTPHALYERDAPGVVYIRAAVSKPVPDPFALGYARRQGVSTGSGFLLDRAGDILTTWDVIAGADPESGVTVQFGDQGTVPALVVGSEPSEDLAVLRVAPQQVPPIAPLPLGDSATVRVGDPALAIGDPYGSDRTLTTGTVSALQRELSGPDGTDIDNVIETEMPVYPGTSGGPVLDAGGRVIGVTSQLPAGEAGAIAFAIPVDTARVLLSQVGAGHSHCAPSLRCGRGGKHPQDQVLRHHQPG